MQTTLTLNPERSVARISPDADLTEVAFAVEGVCGYFLGRGIYRFDCRRTQEEDGSCVLAFTALNKGGPMQVSKIGAVGHAVRQGLFPTDLPQNERFQMQEPGFVREGQHRHGGLMHRKDAGHAVSIVESHDFDPASPMALITYGLGDMFTGLFALGVRYVKWQGSLKTIQLYIRHQLTDKRLTEYLLSDKDYDIRRKVGTLK